MTMAKDNLTKAKDELTVEKADLMTLAMTTAVATAVTTAVTTAVDPTSELIQRAAEIAGSLGCPVVPRGRRGLKQLLARYQLQRVFVVTHDALVLHSADASVFWHPGTAMLKLWRYAAANPKREDPAATRPMDLVVAAAIESGDRILDCTLGYGSDAIVMSWAVGATGGVVGLEADPALAYLTAEGLKHYPERHHVSDEVAAAMGRIQVVSTPCLDYLRTLPDNSFDVVYFDPMFQEAVEGSVALGALRHFAHTAPLDRATVAEAQRVSRRRVVVKERIGSGVFETLGITQTIGGWRTGAIAYGFLLK